MAKRTQITVSREVSEDIGDWVALGDVVANVIEDLARRTGVRWQEDHDRCRETVAPHASNGERSP